jgi:UDP:flavonoid glycosyltransferase YjiC (YdhE family)
VRVAIVTGNDPGHVFPAAALAGRLRERGHRPTVLTTRRWLAPLARDGIDATVPPAGPPEQADRAVDFGYRLHGRPAELAPVTAEALRRLEPDLVVADVLAANGALAAELLGIPYVELVPHVLHLPSIGLPPPGSGLVAGRTVLGRGRDAVLRKLSDRSRAAGDGQRAAARATLGLPPTAPEPAGRLVATLPLLEPVRPDWPARTDVVGPLLWDPAVQDLKPPPGDAPLVLLVASTVASGRPGLLEAALAGLTGVRLAAPMLAAPELALPDWAVAGPGRLAPLLAAADLVISGAGHGMVGRTLAAGRPLVLAPGGGDQRELAHRVTGLGAGVTIGRLTPASLSRAVHRVLINLSYRAAADRIAATPARTDAVDACERAADWAG